MQAGQPVSMSGTVDAMSEELERSLKIAEFDPKIEPSEQSAELGEQLGSDHEEGEGEDEDGDEDEGEEFEFSFPCGNPNSSPIAAEDAFHNGQIRPIFPVFDQSLLSDEQAASSSSPHQPLRKLFAEGSGRVSTSTKGESEADHCPWEGKTVEEIKSPAAGALCQKSNSTGSSRLWRFRDLVHRSSSDGKDAFVFLNPPAAAPGDGERDRKKKAAKGSQKSEEKTLAAKGRGNGKKAAAAAPPPFYGRSKAAPEKRRSYLPYRPGLVGFFTSVNGMSKNVHPF
ncbi:hypothetical protein CDL15_Pgr024391 [Punica granatum]|uniref:Uncharacterized protein n=2 Tax=Punica granatum TaxID=22663 RepID=A0A218XXD3_PUNGR|nr:hypothetical protein CDL15_Pgr024391 [Punica granatum]